MQSVKRQWDIIAASLVTVRFIWEHNKDFYVIPYQCTKNIYSIVMRYAWAHGFLWFYFHSTLKMVYHTSLHSLVNCFNRSHHRDRQQLWIGTLVSLCSLFVHYCSLPSEIITRPFRLIYWLCLYSIVINTFSWSFCVLIALYILVLKVDNLLFKVKFK